MCDNKQFNDSMLEVYRENGKLLLKFYLRNLTSYNHTLHNFFPQLIM
jgi:hypothetical protein